MLYIHIVNLLITQRKCELYILILRRALDSRNKNKECSHFAIA